MKKYTSMGLILALIFASTSGYPDSGIPAQIKAKMNGLVGNWEFEEETKETRTSEPESSTGTWEARWLFDNLIEWRATASSSQGTETNVEYEGYDPILQGYSYWFASNGWRGQLFDGHWDGNTARFQTISTAIDGSRWRGRCMFRYNNDFTAVSYDCEALEDGMWWVWRSGNAKKVKK